MINFLQIKIKKLYIADTIESNELMVRAIVSPLFYSQSKKRLHRQAFLPPPARNDVSLYRRQYANASKCKKCATKLKLGESKYCGLAIFLATDVLELNMVLDLGITATLKASPLDKDAKPITRRPVYRWENGMPFHADLVYDFLAQEGHPNTVARKYADELCIRAQYFDDPKREKRGWHGLPLQHNLKSKT